MSNYADGARLLRGHPRLSQAGVIGGLEQGIDLRQRPKSALHAGDAQIVAVMVRPPGFGEFYGGTLGFAFEAIYGGEAKVNPR